MLARAVGELHHVLHALLQCVVCEACRPVDEYRVAPGRHGVAGLLEKVGDEGAEAVEHRRPEHGVGSGRVAHNELSWR